MAISPSTTPCGRTSVNRGHSGATHARNMLCYLEHRLRIAVAVLHPKFSIASMSEDEVDLLVQSTFHMEFVTLTLRVLC